MILFIAAGNMHQADAYARVDLGLRKGEWRYLSRLDLLNGIREATVVLGPFYHRAHRLSAIGELHALLHNHRIALLHHNDDAEAIASYVISLRQYYGE